MRNNKVRQKKHRIARRKTAPAEHVWWSDSDMLDLVREAATTVGQPLSFPAFELWAADNGHVTPAERTWTTRFGSWTEACETAGIEPVRSTWGGKPGTYTTVDQCLDAVREFVAECGTEGCAATLSRYERVSKDRGWPARNTLYVRVAATWPEILEQVGADAPDVSTRCVSYTTEQIEQAVEAAAKARVTTMREYMNWRAAQPDSATIPSAGRVAAHYDGWKNLRAILEQVAAA